MNRTIKTVSVFLSGIILVISLSGCAWWLTNSSTLEPVESCLIGQIMSGGLSDPLAIVAGCAGATLTALSTLLMKLITGALPAADAGVVAGEMSPYLARLLVLQQHTNALLDAGVK